MIDGFFELPASKKTWFLDTCVWGEIVSSNEVEDNFVDYVKANKLLVGLTYHTLVELSRAKRLLSQFDNLFSKLPLYVWLAMPYDHLFDTELVHYPKKPKIKWLPLSALRLDGKQVKDVMVQFAQNPLFIGSRQETLEYGHGRFMSLTKFKRNFPPSEGGTYSPDQAYTFSQLNGIDYFCRHEPHFLKRIGVRDFVPEGIPSLFARSLFLFYKYYIHGQSPEKSDFIDYAHIAYLPYVNVYVTEKNASNVIRHIQSEGLCFEGKKVLNVSQFIKKMLSA